MAGIFSLVAGIFNKGLELVNKFVPSRDEQAGRAKAERDQAKEALDARDKMDAVDPADSRTTRKRLRKGEF